MANHYHHLYSIDASSWHLIHLDLIFPPELDKLAQDDNRITVSAEYIDLLDMDVAIWPADSAEIRSKVEALSLYQGLKLATEGR